MSNLNKKSLDVKSDNLQIFNNDSFGEIRTIMKDGEPWFVAKDVCDCLVLSNPSVVVERLDEDERAKFNLGRQGETNIINEFGLYSLILGSRKKEAKQFKRWITHEVIPSIRKTGSYSIVPRNYIEALEETLKLAKKNEQLVLENIEKDNIIIEKDNIIDTNKPKIETYERVIECGDELYAMANAAKLLKLSIFFDGKLKLMGRNILFDFLRFEKILDNRNIPYQRFVTQGYFEVKVVENEYGRFSTTYATSKGLAFIYKRYLRFLDNNELTLEDVKTENIRFERIV